MGVFPSADFPWKVHNLRNRHFLAVVGHHDEPDIRQAVLQVSYGVGRLAQLPARKDAEIEADIGVLDFLHEGGDAGCYQRV